MKFLVRAIVTGFALSLGSALFKKVAPSLGLDDKKKEKDDSEQVNAQEGASDPGLHAKVSVT
jgi:hypothetical protein